MQIIHRFTPPTCTLEIWGKNSPLSRWTKQQVIKNLGFKLRFDDPRTPEEEQITISGDREQLEQIYDLVLDYSENFLCQSFVPESFALSSISDSETVNNNLHFTTQALVSHELKLGDLASGKAPEKIQVSALQLFDLISALEEYKSKIAALDKLEASPTKLNFPLWTKIAAVLVVTVGGANIAFQLAKEPTLEETAISLQQEAPPLTDITEVIPPQVPKKETKPTPQPELTEPLSSASTLPPPPAIDLPKPPPDIPNPENYPLPEVGQLVAPEITSFSELQPPPLETETTSQAKTQSPQVESTITVPQEESESKSLETPKKDTTSSNESNARKEQIALDPDKTIDDYIRDRLSRENTGNDLDSAAEQKNRPNNSELRAKKPNPSISDISQIKEVKSYFEQKWQPPAELTRTLEYRLVLNKNGSIKRIIPIGKASEIYIDRTNLPLRGEVFVSPLKNTEQATIRLLLSPDGDVNTFLE